MVAVAVAEDDGVDRAKTVDIGQKARRRAFAEVEQEPPAAGLDQEGGRPLLADARKSAATTAFAQSLGPNPCLGTASPDIDNRTPRP